MTSRNIYNDLYIGSVTQGNNLYVYGNSFITTLTTNNLLLTDTLNGEVDLSISNKSTQGNAYSMLRLSTGTNPSFNIFQNSETRTSDGGLMTTTLRNDAGSLRLQANTGNGILLDSTGNIYIQRSTSYLSEIGSFTLTGTNSSKRLCLGFDEINNYSWIQSVWNTVDTTPLFLNPLGGSGNVGVRTTTASHALTVSGGVFSTSMTTTNMIMTNLTTASISGLTTLSVGNVISSNISTSTLTGVSNLSLTNLTTSSISGLTTLSVGNIVSNNISTSTLTGVSNLSLTNLTTASISGITTLSVGNVISSNISTSTLTGVSNLSLTNLTTASITGLTTLSVGNVISSNISTSTLTGVSNLSLTNLTTASISGLTTLSVGNIVSNNISTSTLTGVSNLSLTNLTVSNSNLTNITSTNVNLTNVTSTNINSTNITSTTVRVFGSSIPTSELGTLNVTGTTGTKRLAVGFDETNNFGWIQSVWNTQFSLPLFLNPIGGLGNVGIRTTTASHALTVNGGVSSTTITSGNVLFTNTTSVSLISTDISTSTLSGLTNLSLTNITTTSLRGLNISTTNISTTTLTGLSNLSLTNLTTTTLTGLSNLSLTNLTTSSITGLTNLSLTNLTTSSITGLTNLSLSNASISNIISTNISSVTLNLSNGLTAGSSLFTRIKTAGSNANQLLIEATGSINEASIRFTPNTSGTTYFALGNGITNFVGQENFCLYNSFTDSINIRVFQSGVVSMGSLNTVNLTTGNAVLTNLTTTSLSGLISLSVGNLISNSISTSSLSGINNLSVTNITTTSVSGIVNLSLTNISTTTLSGISSLSLNNGVITNITANNLLVTDTLNGEVDLSISNQNTQSNAYSILRLSTGTNSSFNIFQNSETRTVDGGIKTTTLRNDAGSLRLQANTGNGILLESTGNIYIQRSTAYTGEIGSLTLSGSSSTFKRLAMGIEETSNYGWIQAVWNGVDSMPLYLNPLSGSGNVGVRTTSASHALTVSGGVFSTSMTTTNMIMTNLTTSSISGLTTLSVGNIVSSNISTSTLTGVSNLSLTNLTTASISGLTTLSVGNIVSSNISTSTLTGLTTLSVANMFANSFKSSGVVIGGSFTRGSIYNDPNWGFLLKSNNSTRSTVSVFSVNDYDDTNVMRIDNNYILGLPFGVNTPSATLGNMRFMTNGNIGIGTSTPIRELDITGNLGLRRATDTETFLDITNQNSSLQVGIFTNTAFTGASYLSNPNNKDMLFATNNTLRMTLKNNGNLGIGEYNPTSLLVVNGNISSASLQSGSISSGSLQSSVITANSATMSNTLINGLTAITNTVIGGTAGSNLLAIRNVSEFIGTSGSANKQITISWGAAFPVSSLLYIYPNIYINSNVDDNFAISLRSYNHTGGTFNLTRVDTNGGWANTSALLNALVIRAS